MIFSEPFTPAAMMAVPGNMVPGVLVKRVQPSYPGVAQAGQVDGDVAMNVTVAVDGTVQDIHVTHGLPQLIPAATHAVSQWRYSPARINGVAVPINTRIVIHFGFSADADEQNKLALKGGPVPSMLFKPVLPPAPPGVLRIAERVMNGWLASRVDPVYPADAVPLDAQGTVVLLETVDKSGKVSDVQVLSGPLRFRESALSAVKQWTYHPYETEDGPVTVQSTVTLSFAPPNQAGSSPH